MAENGGQVNLDHTEEELEPRKEKESRCRMKNKQLHEHQGNVVCQIAKVEENMKKQSVINNVICCREIKRITEKG